MKKLITSVFALAMLLQAAPASAVVTQTNVTAPANPTMVNSDLSIPSIPLNVSGTAIAGPGDTVDIWCAIGADGTDGFDIETGVPVTGGSFSAVVDQQDFDYYICRLIAVPAGATGPFDLSTFSGPVVGNGSFQRLTVASGANVGQLYDYTQNSSSPAGYWSVESAGRCYLQESYPVDPSTLDYDDLIWGCSVIPQDPSGTKPLTIDGAKAFLPYEQTDTAPGFGQITDFTNTVDPVDGTMRVSDTETPVICADAGCSGYSGSGLKLRQKQTGGTGGNTLAIEHVWVNETTAPKQLDVTYRVEADDNAPGWKLPGESGYTARTPGEVVPLAGPGPGSIFVAIDPGDTCLNVLDPCGSVTWRRAPTSAVFFDDDRLDLTYSVSIPAGKSKTIGLTYSHGFPQAAVDGYAAAAEQSYTPSTEFTVGKQKLNKKKGTAKLPVDVPGAGVLQADGKKVKTFEVETTEAGTVQVPVAAKGKKAKKKLKKKGKLKVAVAITFTPEDWPDSSTQTKKPTLKKKSKKKGGGKK